MPSLRTCNNHRRRRQDPSRPLWEMMWAAIKWAEEGGLDRPLIITAEIEGEVRRLRWDGSGGETI